MSMKRTGLSGLNFKIGFGIINQNMLGILNDTLMCRSRKILESKLKCCQKHELIL